MLQELLYEKGNVKNLKEHLELAQNFFTEKKEIFPTLEDFLKDERNVLNIRRDSLSFVRKHLNKLNKWDIRLFASELFKNLNIKMEEDTSEKFIFLLFTDAICEVFPESVPLVFFYQDFPIVKKHGIVIDFDILPFMVQTIDELSPEKKHQLVLTLYSEEELVLKGISKYLSEINFLLLNLLDKVLYKEIIPFDKVVVKKGSVLQPDKDIIRFMIQAVFAGVVEKFLNQRENLSGLLNKEKTGYFTKIKRYIKKDLEDKDEVLYLKETAKADEESIENRLLAIRDYENQKNVFEESIKREDVPIPEKMESVFWLLGIENINPVLLVRYYDGDDIIYFLHNLLRQAQDEGFLTDNFKEEVKHFLFKLFQYPYISKGFINKKTLDKPMRLLFEDEKLLTANYYYFTRRYEKFLDIEKEVQEKTPELKLKQLLAKFYTSEFSKDELVGWLSLDTSKEGQFLYKLLTNDLSSLFETNEYRYVADLYTVKASPEEVANIIGEEGLYTLILRILGFYPYDKTLLTLAELKFET